MDLEMMLDEDYKEGICLIDFSQIALSTALVNFPDKEKINLSMVRHLILNSIKFNVKKAKRLDTLKLYCVLITRNLDTGVVILLTITRKTVEKHEKNLLGTGKVILNPVIKL